MPNASRKLTRKSTLYREAQGFGSNAAFVANVILCGHSRPTTKLAGLVALLRGGHEVSCAPFHIEYLWIDGAGRYSYSDLEKGLAALASNPAQGFSPGRRSPAAFFFFHQLFQWNRLIPVDSESCHMET